MDAVFEKAMQLRLLGLSLPPMPKVADFAAWPASNKSDALAATNLWRRLDAWERAIDRIWMEYSDSVAASAFALAVARQEQAVSPSERFSMKPTATFRRLR